MSGAFDVGASIAFVRAKGSPRDQALLKVLLGEPLSDADLEAVREGQNPDGGFRVRELKTQASVVGRSAEMVLYFAALGAADFGCAQAAADFLIERQGRDGTWGEAESLAAATPPAHFSPGSDDVIGWETAASILALTGMGFTLDFRAALEWMAHHRVGPAGARVFRVEAVLAIFAFGRHPLPHDDGAGRLRGEVNALANGPLEVFELNFSILGARAAGVGPTSQLVARLGAALAPHQREDGGFGSSPQPNGFETVLSLCSLEHAGVITLPRTHAAADHEADPAKSDHGI